MNSLLATHVVFLTRNHARARADWGWVGTGPPATLQLSSGRLLTPAYHATFHGGDGQLSHGFALLSDDNGTTWTLGGEMRCEPSTRAGRRRPRRLTLVSFFSAQRALVAQPKRSAGSATPKRKCFRDGTGLASGATQRRQRRPRCELLDSSYCARSERAARRLRRLHNRVCRGHSLLLGSTAA